MNFTKRFTKRFASGIKIGLVGHFAYCYEHLLGDIFDLIEDKANNLAGGQVGKGDAKPERIALSTHPLDDIHRLYYALETLRERIAFE
ncbi:MAG TPA: hypothetical protein VLL52_17515 [Anaerolineae bacterium]|nr:hypothetical protein [Anaerolineae bacterium]